MTDGSNIDKSSLVYKIEDFYETFEVFEQQSMRRWSYRAYLSILALLFLLSLFNTLMNIMIFREYVVWLAITVFFELNYLSINKHSKEFLASKKLEKLKINFACSYNDLNSVKGIWLKNNFAVDQLNII